jgi:hypothetical protein
MITVGKNFSRLPLTSLIERRAYEDLFSPFCRSLNTRIKYLHTEHLRDSITSFRRPILITTKYSGRTTKLCNNTKHFFTSPRIRDYYKTLGVPKTSTKREIKLAYLQLAKETHPDVNPGDVNAQERFQKIAEAYTVLSDDNQRQQYDSYGVTEDQQRRNPYASGFTPPPNVNPYDVFKQAFEDVGLQELINNVELTKEEAMFAINAAGKGDWEPAKTFVSENKVLMVGVMAPLIVLVRFPWIFALFIRSGTVAIMSLLAICARNPRLAVWIGSVLYRRFMHAYIPKAKRAAAKKSGK